MANIKSIVSIAALYAVLAVTMAHVIQEGLRSGPYVPPSEQGTLGERVLEGIEEYAKRNLNWTSCNTTTTPIFSCHDCNTRLICSPTGALLLPCKSPVMSHCNHGFCSHVPSSECSSE